MADRRAKGGQEAAFWKLLVRLGLRPVDVKADASEHRHALVTLGQVGLALARDLDRPDAYGRAGSAKELRSIIDTLTGAHDDKEPDGADHHHEPGSWDDPS